MPAAFCCEPALVSEPVTVCSYQHSGKPTAAEKVIHSLSEMGISVWSAAATTLIASLVLWRCSTLVFFNEFGAFLTVCMLVSVLTSLSCEYAAA